MNTRTLSVLLIGLALVAPVFAQGRQRAPSLNQPPVASTNAERRILGILDRMVASGSLYLAVPADNGRMLRLLAETTGARNVAEIGTSTGYSGLWISLALLRTGGKLTTFELDPGRAAEARKHFEQAGVTGLIEVIVGDAHENVTRLKGPIDLLFLDADKEGYASYLKTLLPLVRPGGQTVVVPAGPHQIPTFVRVGPTLALGGLPREWDDARRIARERPKLKALEADVFRWCAPRAVTKPPE